MRNSIKYLTLALGLAGLAHTGLAGAAACSVSDVRVTAIGQYDGVSAGATLGWGNLAGGADAAACAGAYAGNDQPVPTTNLGYAGDGLLNGAQQSTSPYASPFAGGAFITGPEALNDLQGDGTANDPGWIMLGRLEFNDTTPGSFDPAAVGGNADLVRTSFFSVTATGTGQGTWSFTPDAEVAQRAAPVLGSNYFDQFALVFKAANDFAVYDFTADQFGLATDPDNPVYAFSGTYDTSDALLTKSGRSAGISHISLWARDPGAPTTQQNVPEPGTLALLGVAFVGLGFVRRIGGK